MMEEKMEGATFVGASRLANGGVIFDCKDEATAEWVRQTHVVRQFVAALGSNCVYRPRRTELIAEMVGVEARVEEAGFWRVVETDSGITEGGIESARWIKAVERRTPGQRVAHLRVAFANAEAANHAIDNGLFVQGRHVRVRKSDNEPVRCARCQSYDGHFARACTAPANVCARCALDHRTAECLVTEQDLRCGNCKASGHSAASRGCPAFVKAHERRRVRDPTSGYRYIPTLDPRTWVTSAALTPREEEAEGGVAPSARGHRQTGGEDARDKEEAAAPTMVGRDDAGLSTRRGASTPARRCGRAPWLTRFSVRQGHELLRGAGPGEMSGRQNDTAPRMEDGEIPQQWGDLQQQDGLPPAVDIGCISHPKHHGDRCHPALLADGRESINGDEPIFLTGPGQNRGRPPCLSRTLRGASRGS
ncbi:hypothetical protein MSAN_01670900 [Mycena sanguinolenta]|uniref:Gag-like protein n=1 Tax=Mycena sanguinolenta TaxID=230812 RepID=A0A8H7CUT2_9AGAR|nr:hypothetical protein MSAN_01670900 [Mycena sanguinolenta]